MNDIKLSIDTAACRRARVSFDGGYIGESSDGESLIINGFIRADADYRAETGLSLVVDLLFLHEDGFLLQVSTISRSFLLEYNNVEAFHEFVFGFGSFFVEDDLAEIRLMPRWERKDQVGD